MLRSQFAVLLVKASPFDPRIASHLIQKNQVLSEVVRKVPDQGITVESAVEVTEGDMTDLMCDQEAQLLVAELVHEHSPKTDVAAFVNASGWNIGDEELASRREESPKRHITIQGHAASINALLAVVVISAQNGCSRVGCCGKGGGRGDRSHPCLAVGDVGLLSHDLLLAGTM